MLIVIFYLHFCYTQYTNKELQNGIGRLRLKIDSGRKRTVEENWMGILEENDYGLFLKQLNNNVTENFVLFCI